MGLKTVLDVASAGNRTAPRTSNPQSMHYMNYVIPAPYRPTELAKSALNRVILSVGTIRCMAERTQQV